ncbi:SMP-30/Gluconolaconase/LRE-like region family protein [Rhodococcus sp. MTM3W5.2]|uniref:SMP-30/gluconolactonase/LRE family protein n=1 Tax=Rhodococcus sp. MTM3W5.2 TaxID=1805827 RepID=UPI00097976BD|nr:SMP-30/gluconolactonase/LRE family protein [Rhodococcus sp. MTM3W5.2]AQA24411.1 SMP-30/Gluconolaconase/LRE-like region family protein [Rhodococcus sp. MTM3W5.2]
MLLSRVAMVGALVATGAIVGAPIAVAQPAPVQPAPTPAEPVATTTPTVAPPFSLPGLTSPLPGVAAPTTTAAPVAPTTSAAPAAATPAATAAPTTAPATSTPASSAPAPAAATTTPSITTTTAAAQSCTPWKASEVASGFGMLENLAFDGRGMMLLSEGTLFGDGAIRTLSPGGKTGTLVSDFTGPGGIVVNGDSILFTTGNNAMAGLSNSKNGTVESLDLDTGEQTTVAKGLTMPNGLVKLANGDLLVTRNLGSDQGLTRIPAAQPGSPASVRTDLGSANGLAVSADGATVYVGNTFDSNTEIRELNATDLKGAVHTMKVAGSGASNAGDDLTVGDDGNIYMALNGAGKVVRVDPTTGSTCEIGSDLPLTSSVRFGSGPGWDPAALYTTSFDGSVHKLVPPKSS